MSLLKRNEPSEPVDPYQVEGDRAANRTKLLLGVGVVAALVAAAAGWFVLSSGGGTTSAGGSGPVATAAPTGPAATTAPSATASAPIQKYTGKNARDPFKALVVAPVAVATPASSPGSGGGPSPSTSAPTSGPVPSSTTPSPTATATPATPTKVTMVTVAADDASARISVSSKVYDVKPLEKFATNFKLLNLYGGRCGAIQYGDVTFDLCEGQSLSVH